MAVYLKMWGIDPIKTTRKKAMPPGRILGVQKISDEWCEKRRDLENYHKVYFILWIYLEVNHQFSDF